ncbi:hypothetical protein [Pedobacter sp. KACC 23697]|uniref:Abi family protein n=1 Tax=Pedobacter sp. KACC 23697 TaxID=3149230 RepID=A0AAU7K156_9SPHI
MIKFSEFQNGKIKTNEVARLIREAISIEDIFMYSNYELTFRSLSTFNFKKLEYNKTSVEKYAQKVLAATGFLKNVSDPVLAFVRVFLDKGERLLEVKNNLESKAKGHLQQIQSLLEHYYQQPFIMEYRSKPTTPRNNLERKLLTFYRRTVDKKEEIVEYLLNGILVRALEKSAPGYKRDWGEGLEELSRQFEEHDDFPYLEQPYVFDFNYHLNMEKLDYRLINPLLNKFGYMEQDAYKLGRYTKAINDGFEKRIRPKLFFPSLLNDLAELPVIGKRWEIFKEMEFLFEEGKWYSLYALALPQVEGIFSEMLEMIAKKKTKGSLTEKVNSVRQYYEFAHYTFDYYEFTLADLRNSFSHSGKVENPKIKCFHLLLDIKYLLSVFMDFDAPLSKLSKIIKAGHEKFNHIGDFAYFITLLDMVNSQDRLDSISDMASNFVYRELSKKINLVKMIGKLEFDFQQSVRIFDQRMSNLLKDRDFKLFQSQNKIILERLDQIEGGFNNLPIMVNEQYKLILDSQNFAFNFPRYFPKLPKQTLKKIQDFRVAHQQEWGILNLLNKKAKFTLAEDFLIYERELSHVIEH